MIVYLDTNIIIDIISLRQPHYADSQAVLDRCSDLECKAFVGWHGVATAHYIVGLKVGEAIAQTTVRDFLQFVQVATTGDSEMHRALTLGFKDLEDAMQAEACGADFIVTRNTTDFAASPVPVLAPADFLAQFPVV